jgi:uncharacterized membrane protein YqjE
VSTSGVFELELREEIDRRTGMLVCGLVGAVFLHTAFILVTLLVAAIFWDTHRLAALGAMAALYTAVGGGFLIVLRDRIARAPPPFEATLASLREDIARWRAAPSTVLLALALPVLGIGRMAKVVAFAGRFLVYARTARALLGFMRKGAKR